MRDAVSKYLFPPCERTEQNLLQAEWCWVRTPVKSLKQGSGVRKPIKGTRLWYSVCRETWLYIVHAGLGEFEYKSKDKRVWHFLSVSDAAGQVTLGQVGQGFLKKNFLSLLLLLLLFQRVGLHCTSLSNWVMQLSLLPLLTGVIGLTRLDTDSVTSQPFHCSGRKILY